MKLVCMVYLLTTVFSVAHTRDATTPPHNASDQNWSDLALSGVSSCGAAVMSGVVGELRQRYAATGRTSPRRIIINPGEGTTGTRGVHGLAECCGLHTWKWDNTARSILAADPRTWEGLNFSSIMTKIEYASDTPMAYLWPRVLATFPNAFVLHTTRNSSAWVRSRIRGHAQSVRPFGWAFGRVGHGINERDFHTTDPQRVANADVLIDGLMYEAETSVARCAVDQNRYLHLPMETLCEPAQRRAIATALRCLPEVAESAKCMAAMYCANSTR